MYIIKKHVGKQGLTKQRGRCRSRLLPGIVRRTDEGGRLRKSENITKQVHQWEEAIESIPLAKLGDDSGDFLFPWLPISEHQQHLCCLIWSFELLHLQKKNTCAVSMSKLPLFYTLLNVYKRGFPILWFPGRLSDMDQSHAFALDPGIGAKVLMVRATIAAKAASPCDRRALWTYKGRRLKEAGAGGGRGAGEGLSQGLKALAEIADPFQINDSGEKLSSKKCFGICGGPPN